MNRMQRDANEGRCNEMQCKHLDNSHGQSPRQSWIGKRLECRDGLSCLVLTLTNYLPKIL